MPTKSLTGVLADALLDVDVGYDGRGKLRSAEYALASDALLHVIVLSMRKPR